MANKAKGEVPLTLGDGVKVLCFDMNALAELEEAFRQPVNVFLKELRGSIGISKLRTLLFHGLQVKHADEFATLADVGGAMEMSGIGDYGKAVGRALALAVTGKEPAAVKEKAAGDVPLLEAKPKEEPGTGNGS